MCALLISTLLVFNTRNISVLLLFMFSVANVPLTAQILSDHSDFHQYVHDCGYVDFRVSLAAIHVYACMLECKLAMLQCFQCTALMMNISMNE